MSSSIVSVPTIDRSDPSRTFFTIESTCSGLASRNLSAALRSDSTSRPILNVATPFTTRNGVDVTKSGIGRCSLSANRGCGGYDQIGPGDGDDLDHATSRYLGVRGGGHVV